MNAIAAKGAKKTKTNNNNNNKLKKTGENYIISYLTSLLVKMLCTIKKKRFSKRMHCKIKKSLEEHKAPQKAE